MPIVGRVLPMSNEREELIRILKDVYPLDEYDNRYEEEAADRILELIQQAKAKAWNEGGEARMEREYAYGAEEKAKYANPYLKGAGDE